MASRPFVRVVTPALAAAMVAAGCGDQPAAPKGVAGNVALAPGAFTLYTGRQAAGPLRFPATDTAGAEYLVVGQLATTQADLSASYTLGGSAVPLAEAAGLVGAARQLPLAVRFHDALRRMDEAVALASLRQGWRAPPAAPRAGPPPVGDQRTFKVCANLDCSSLVNVTAVAQVVGARAAIYVDVAAPSGGFSLSDLQALSQQFDGVLYPIDTLAFGPPSDIDGNGVVIILMTPKVNALISSPACQQSFVTGFFLAADLAAATRATYNDGEVFYAMVPDPLGTVSCPQPVSRVKAVIPPTFIHEFQHMISFNQHTLVRNGPTEVLWLNEAMSHLAEELGGRHYDSLGVDTTASRFLFGDLYNAYQYLVNPAANAMISVTGPDDLSQRGGQWLFLRYLVDRYGPATTQRLEQTSLTGDANVVSAAGSTPFATLLGRWALAVYVSDLPSFTADTLISYANWHFRTTFASLHQQLPTDFSRIFPLVPLAATGGSFAATGTIRSGSGSYVYVTQPAGAPAFTVTFTQPGGLALNASGNPQLAIVRIH